MGEDVIKMQTETLEGRSPSSSRGVARDFTPRYCGRGSECGSRQAWLWGRNVAWYLPCRPWAQQYQLLPSHRASPVDLEGPEPQGGQLGQMHPGVGGRQGISGGQIPSGLQYASPPSPSPLPRLPFYLLFHASPLPFLLLPRRPPRPAQRTLTASASLTLGPSVPGVPGRPR